MSGTGDNLRRRAGISSRPWALVGGKPSCISKVNVLSGALSQQRIRVDIHSPLINGWEAATRQPASFFTEGWGTVFPVCASPLNARRNLNK